MICCIGIDATRVLRDARERVVPMKRFLFLLTIIFLGNLYAYVPPTFSPLGIKKLLNFVLAYC